MYSSVTIHDVEKVELKPIHGIAGRTKSRTLLVTGRPFPGGGIDNRVEVVMFGDSVKALTVAKLKDPDAVSTGALPQVGEYDVAVSGYIRVEATSHEEAVQAVRELVGSHGAPLSCHASFGVHAAKE